MPLEHWRPLALEDQEINVVSDDRADDRHDLAGVAAVQPAPSDLDLLRA